MSDHYIKSSVNLDNHSILKSFPDLPLNQTVYGCYELNAQFHYAFTSDFNNSLIQVKCFLLLKWNSIIKRFNEFCLSFKLNNVEAPTAWVLSIRRQLERTCSHSDQVALDSKSNIQIYFWYLFEIGIRRCFGRTQNFI